jgi:transcriptional regulator with XRE-family HTH domain
MKTSVLEILGIRIREQRKALKWTQEELADIAGIDRSYIGGVERGERNITFTMLCKICEALKCEVSDLTSGIPEIQK